MAITIPVEEMEQCKQLMRPAWIVSGLQNDLLSWEKELESAKRRGLKNVVNAIWVLMKERSISVDEAKTVCRSIIRENVSKHLKILEENRTNEDLSTELRRYMEAMQYSLSGNAVWGLICPRYHPSAQFSTCQTPLLGDDEIANTLSSDHQMLLSSTTNIATVKNASKSAITTVCIGQEEVR